MKIAIISSCSFPPSEGLATHILSLSQHLKNGGHEVTVFVRRGGAGTLEEAEYGGIKYVLVPSTSLPAISSIIFSMRLKATCILKNFDVIHYHSPLVAPVNLRKREGQKILTTFHSTMRADTRYIEMVSFHAFLNKVMGAVISPIFEKRLAAVSDRVIAVSDSVESELVQLYGISLGKIRVIVNGIDTHHFRNRGVKKKKQILFVGRLGYRKGLPELLRAIHKYFAEGGEYRFIFAGDGPLADKLQRAIEVDFPNGAVEWLGNVSEAKLPELISECEFLVMPSTYETGPRVVLEAMATGTPVIATQVGLLRGFDETDFIKIDGTNEAAILKALKFATTASPALHESLVNKSIQVSRRFSSEFVYKEVEHAYK